MSDILYLETISDIHKLLPEASIKHPLVTVIDFARYHKQFSSGIKIRLDFYSVMFKNYCQNQIKYGQKTYDFQEGSLLCIAPQRIITLDEPIQKKVEISGWGLFFHPDLIRGTSLGKTIKEYSFFYYHTNEALHLSDKEKQNLNEIVKKLNNELTENIDNHSQTIIISYIELLLNYCRRYYDRQFITRKIINSEIVARVEAILANYFQQPDLSEKGLPTVKHLAEHVHLSHNYLSDLLKRETGMNAQDYIHNYIIEEAKNLLLSSNKTIGEIAFSLGFQYPQYFSRLFKIKTGMTPIEYRNTN